LLHRITRSLPELSMETANTSQLLTELQSQGLRLADDSAGAPSRRGGAGPSDHKAVTIDGRTIMVPVHSADARASAFEVVLPRADGGVTLKRNSIPIKEISFPKQPRFYKLQTFDGVPYWKIATLHVVPVLRDRRIAEGRAHDQSQDAGTARRSRACGDAARRHPAHGDDHRHAELH